MSVELKSSLMDDLLQSLFTLAPLTSRPSKVASMRFGCQIRLEFGWPLRCQLMVSTRLMLVTQRPIQPENGCWDLMSQSRFAGGKQTRVRQDDSFLPQRRSPTE